MRIGAESGSGFVCFEADERPRISAIGVLSDTSTFVLRFLGLDMCAKQLVRSGRHCSRAFLFFVRFLRSRWLHGRRARNTM
jgi:hypothetical protein